MRYFIAIFAVLFFLNSDAEAQFLKNLRKKVEQEVEKQVHKKVEEGVDDAFNGDDGEERKNTTSSSKFTYLSPEHNETVSIPFTCKWKIANSSDYSYEVQLDGDNFADWVQVKVKKGKTSTTFKDFPVSNLSGLKWRVIAKKGGKSIESPWIDFKVSQSSNANENPEGFYDVYPPDGATDVEIPVKFGWKVDGSSIDQYGHEFYLHTTDDIAAHMIGGPVKKEFTVEDLEPGTTYYWRVVAAGDNGYIPNDIMSFTTAGTPKMNLNWSNFDFVPGDEVIFEDGPDMMEENGEFPSRWDLVSGQVEIAEVNGEMVIAFFDGNPKIIPYMKNRKEDYLPDVFTIEYDIYRPGNGNRMFVNFYDEKNQKANDNSEMTVGYNYISIGSSSSEYSADLSREEPRWIHVSIAYTHGKLKAYFDDMRLINIPHYEANPSGFTINPYFADKTEGKIWYLKNVRIAKGGVKYYERVKTEGKIIVNGIKFDTGKATLKPESIGPINKIVKLMKKDPELKFSVEGHTDSDGDSEKNQVLSEQRAKAVVNQMVSMGISPERLTSKGHGDKKPISDNDTPEGKANNRRVEFIKK